MRHYNPGAALRLSFAAIAILVLSASSVNHFGTQRHVNSPNLKADGIPVPPLPPPKGTAFGTEILIADGIPVPPLPPSKAMLIADGIPVPPLPPPKSGGTVGMAV
jgi:hypothetical protein